MRTPCELDEEIVVQNILYIVMLIGVVAVTLVKGCMLIIGARCLTSLNGCLFRALLLLFKFSILTWSDLAYFWPTYWLKGKCHVYNIFTVLSL